MRLPARCLGRCAAYSAHAASGALGAAVSRRGPVRQVVFSAARGHQLLGPPARCPLTNFFGGGFPY